MGFLRKFKSVITEIPLVGNETEDRQRASIKQISNGLNRTMRLTLVQDLDGNISTGNGHGVPDTRKQSSQV